MEVYVMGYSLVSLGDRTLVAVTFEWKGDVVMYLFVHFGFWTVEV